MAMPAMVARSPRQVKNGHEQQRLAGQARLSGATRPLRKSRKNTDA